jgi:hypothetical protein
MKILFPAIAALLVSLGAAAQNLSVTGVVLEAKDVDAYTYLRLKTSEGEVWAAVGKAAVKKGDKVTVTDAMAMTNFKSKTLDRTFDKIIFGNMAGAGTGASPHGGAAAVKAADVGDVRVPKAQGPDAKTVAEIVGAKAALKDKTVVVRGKVVKFTSNVMGRNWVHLRDGTGSEKDGSNDVLVTTRDQTQIGSVVVAKGIVRTDADFGSGYAYKVLIEEATLQK